MRRFAVLLVLVACEPLHAQGPRFLNKPGRQWVQELSSSEAPRRRMAAFALGKIGSQGASYADELVKVLGDADESVREAAAFALGETGALGAADAVKPLTRLVESDRSPAVQRAAAAALGKIGNQAASATHALKKALAHADPRVRQNAAFALGQIGPTALEQTLTELRKLLKDADAMVRRDTVVAIGNAGAAARDAIGDLTHALMDDDSLVKRYAVQALGKLGPAAENAVPMLLTVLDDKQAASEMQREALLALCQIGGAGTPAAFPALRKALRDDDPILREVAAGALITLGEAAQPAVPDLAFLLEDKEYRVRRNATLALDRLLPKADAAAARRAVPGLLHILEKEPTAELRLYAAWCLLQLPVNLKDREFSHAKGVLIRAALKDDSFNVRCEAARAAVFNFGEEAKDVTPTLIENLRMKAARIIDSTSAKASGVGGEDKVGETAVETKGTRDGRVLPAQALGILGKAAGPEAKKALEEAAEDPDSKDLRDAAKKALGNFR
jgi:HEAT repeat protein